MKRIYLIGLWFFTLPGAAAMSLGPDAVRGMMEGPEGVVEVRMRLTPIKAGVHGKPLLLKIHQERNGAQREVSWDVDATEKSYCVSCSDKGLLTACSKGYFPKKGDTIPVLGHDWGLITENLCRVKVEQQPDQMHPSGAGIAVFDVYPTGAKGVYSRFYFSKKSALPFKVVRYEQEQMSSLTQVIQAQQMPWGPAITLARYIFEPGVSELLLEITGGNTVNKEHQFVDVQ